MRILSQKAAVLMTVGPFSLILMLLSMVVELVFGWSIPALILGASGIGLTLMLTAKYA